MTNHSELYRAKYAVEFTGRRLGEGKDGSVFETTRRTAVKFLHDSTIYRRERYAYYILQEIGIDRIEQFQLPELVRYDDDLLAIEMTIVRPPFILDFASAYTEEEVERFAFTDDVLTEREGALEGPIVQAACAAFTDATGLVLLDLSLNNVKFE